MGCGGTTGEAMTAPRTDAALPPRAVRARVATPRVARHVIWWMGRFILRLRFFVVLLDGGIVGPVGISSSIDVWHGITGLLPCLILLLARLQLVLHVCINDAMSRRASRLPRAFVP